MKLRTSFSLFALAWATMGSATSLGLMSTGVDSSGNPLAYGALDSHWMVSPGRNIPGPVNATVLSPSNHFPEWLPNTNRSQWVSTADTINTGAPGNYVYSQSFDLTGFDPTTVFIAGRWTADDDLINIRVNGISVGIDGSGHGPIDSPSIQSPWKVWHPFFIDTTYNATLFNATGNTISFVTHNDDNLWEGVNIQIESCDAEPGVPGGPIPTLPEPGTLAIIALGTLGLLKRRRLSSGRG